MLQNLGMKSPRLLFVAELSPVINSRP